MSPPSTLGLQQLLLDAQYIQVPLTPELYRCNLKVVVIMGIVRGMLLSLICRPVSRSCERVLPISPRACTRVLLYQLHRQVVVGIAGIEVGAQAATVEDRQRNRRRNAGRNGWPNQTSHPQQRLSPGARAQVEAGVEARLVGGDVLARGLDLPACGKTRSGRRPSRFGSAAASKAVLATAWVSARWGVPVRCHGSGPCRAHREGDLGALQLPASISCDGAGFQAFGLLVLGTGCRYPNSAGAAPGRASAGCA